MSSGPPIIGVTTYRATAAWGAWHREAAVLPTAYVDHVGRSGGVPVLLPPADGTPSPEATVAALDGLVLVGGADVDPARYHQEPGPHTIGVDPRRDAHELGLLAAALDRDLPVLAICRGLQLLNVAGGGTLHQHLPDVVGHLGHQPAQGCFDDVTVATVPGTVTAAAVGPTVTVRCSHHQAVDRLGAGLVVTARADDGTIEAVELPGRRFVVAVQWHPEESDANGLFAALSAAAAVVDSRT